MAMGTSGEGPGIQGSLSARVRAVGRRRPRRRAHLETSSETSRNLPFSKQT